MLGAAEAVPAGADGRVRLPWSLSFPLGAMLALSFFVMREPAPSDLLFPVVVGATVLGGHMVSPFRFPFPVVATALAVIAINLAGLLWSRSPIDAARYGAITIYMVFLALLLAGVVGKYGMRGARLVTTSYGIAALIAAGIGLGARFDLVPNSHLFFRGEDGLRIKSTFKDPNVFSPFMVGAVMLWLSQLVGAKRIRLTTVAALGIGVAAVLLAFSRGAWAHLMLSTALYAGMHVALIRDPASIGRLVRAAGLGALALIPGVAVLLAQPELLDYFSERLSLQSYDSQRFGNQSVAWTLATEHPLGMGPGMWEQIPGVIATHNVYARVLTENGLAGLFAYLGFCGAFLLAGLRVVLRRGPAANLAAACMAVTLGALGESFIIDTLHWRHFFLFLGVPLGLWLAEKER